MESNGMIARHTFVTGVMVLNNQRKCIRNAIVSIVE